MSNAQEIRRLDRLGMREDEIAHVTGATPSFVRRTLESRAKRGRPFTRTLSVEEQIKAVQRVAEVTSSRAVHEAALALVQLLEEGVSKSKQGRG